MFQDYYYVLPSTATTTSTRNLTLAVYLEQAAPPLLLSYFHILIIFYSLQCFFSLIQEFSSYNPPLFFKKPFIKNVIKFAYSELFCSSPHWLNLHSNTSKRKNSGTVLHQATLHHIGFSFKRASLLIGIVRREVNVFYS